MSRVPEPADGTIVYVRYGQDGDWILALRDDRDRPDSERKRWYDLDPDFTLGDCYSWEDILALGAVTVYELVLIEPDTDAGAAS